VSDPGRRTPVATDGGPDEPPPVLGTWGRLYALVAIELIVVVLVLLWLTRRYA